MHIVRFATGDNPSPQIGVRQGDGIVPLREVALLSQLWTMRLTDLRRLLEAATQGASTLTATDVRLLAPVDGRTEVWAAGVTYETSREARVEESEQAPDVYQLVYDAERPEIFFKSAAWRVSGDGDAIAIREDSSIDVPEPEVALVLNRFGEIVGLTVCNDVSSRSIEGANPLYLPQAKVYLGSCAIGPAIRPIWEVGDPYALSIGLAIDRRGEQVWVGRASTSQLHRRYEELAAHLFRADIHPEGVILSTGTCLVPEVPFSLQPGDQVRIEVADIGSLRNHVVRGLASFIAVASGAVRAACERDVSSAPENS